MLSKSDFREVADKLIFPFVLSPSIFATGARSFGGLCLVKRGAFRLLYSEIQATSGLKSAIFRTIKINPMRKTASIIPFNAAFAMKACAIGIIKKLAMTSITNTNSKTLMR
jgi:hypothetical protein